MRTERPSLRRIFHVPRVCDDVEVQAFLEDAFFTFRGEGALRGAWDIFADARARFGDLRCCSVNYRLH
jgi:hypothetical protein